MGTRASPTLECGQEPSGPQGQCQAVEHAVRVTVDVGSNHPHLRVSVELTRSAGQFDYAAWVAAGWRIFS